MGAAISRGARARSLVERHGVKRLARDITDFEQSRTRLRRPHLMICALNEVEGHFSVGGIPHFSIVSTAEIGEIPQLEVDTGDACERRSSGQRSRVRICRGCGRQSRLLRSG